MNNLVAASVLLPLGTGVLLVLLHGRTYLQRVLSMLSGLTGLTLAVLLTRQVWTEGIQVVQAGSWRAPYGITLVADLFACMMLLLSWIILLTSMTFAMRDLDEGREQTFFYPVLQFLVVGINLSFVTGDVFNLFVAFEVMLISSYFLLTLGGTPSQLREGFKYLLINATASTLFLMSVALLYGVMGTLNMADLAARAYDMEGDPTLTLIGISFMIVFSIKAALFPLYFWLPRSYFQAPSGIAALFAAMLTKVGVYALVRMFTLIFIHDIGYTHTILLAVAGFTMFLGVLGALAQMDFKSILSFHIISQIGYMIMGLGLYSRLALAGTVFYIAHHIIVKSGLFVLSGVTNWVTGTTDLRRFSGLIASHPVLAGLFFLTGGSLAGVPPLSGFFSKFALLKAGVELKSWGIVAVGLLVSLLTLASMMKIFRKGFWGEPSGDRRVENRLHYAQLIGPAMLLLLLSTAMGLGAKHMMTFALAAAEQLFNPTYYIKAVLGR
jgi:multicomponent Na+:H+ antiporter subunit D